MPDFMRSAVDFAKRIAAGGRPQINESDPSSEHVFTTVLLGASLWRVGDERDFDVEAFGPTISSPIAYHRYGLEVKIYHPETNSMGICEIEGHIAPREEQFSYRKEGDLPLFTPADREMITTAMTARALRRHRMSPDELANMVEERGMHELAADLRAIKS